MAYTYGDIVRWKNAAALLREIDGILTTAELPPTPTKWAKAYSVAIGSS